VSKAKTSDPASAATALAGDETGGNLDKVRDILFGAQVRESDRRFARMEEKLAKDNDDLRAEVRKRLDALEAYIKAELETLTDRLKSEETSRTEAVADVAQGLKEAVKNFDKRVAQLDDQMLKGQRDLRQQLLDQSNRFTDDLQQTQNTAATQLERAVEHLQSDKTGNAALASMFTEMAMRLNNEFHLPDVE
jgi:hypothetical protein